MRGIYVWEGQPAKPHPPRRIGTGHDLPYPPEILDPRRTQFQRPPPEHRVQVLLEKGGYARLVWFKCTLGMPVGWTWAASSRSHC